ncbi:AraC family transcriptional regulator [Amycolatopsis suaedae]|uniref:AraC family transcriptional regulator n=1 Tax=Amycolatopsis suaedae TaxID=2510978 RepID=A0A4Q7JCY5_9PSEU|nr:helix-turn-helix domain-containing protein [Amycolatopsis suaedae]RZQ65229.1 AraC family transcriptional regulator [Amycolatopsis suaedae]
MRLVRTEGPWGSWEIAYGEPHSSLRPHVARYVGYVERSGPGRRHEVPGTVFPLIVNLGEPLRMMAGVFPDGFVAGLYDTPALVDSGGEQTGIQVNLGPLGAQLLLGFPPGELARTAVGWPDLFGGDVVDRMRDTASWAERFTLLDDFLRRRFARAPAVPPGLAYAWRRLAGTGGVLGVGTLAAEVGCSRQHLNRRFGRYLGLPPKTVGKILRFQRVLGELGGSASLAELAVANGYADQAHLTRDFRTLAGVTPAEYRRQRQTDLSIEW